MRTRPAPRPGFTLIELLVAISIMATLTGLVLAGVGRIRAVQTQKATEQSLSKLQLAIDQQWKAVLDQVKQDKINQKIPPTVVAWCDNDTDRAEVVWAYANLKREFPETIAEATTPIIFPAIGTHAAYVLQPRATFASLAGAAGGTVDEQAAVLLYAILSNSSHRGMIASMEDAGTQAQGTITIGGGSFSVFRDSWTQPITFRRFFGADNTRSNNGYGPPQLNEVQNTPYVNGRTKQATPNQLDPIDPRGKVFPPSPTNTWNAAHRNTVENVLHVTFNGQNRLITVISNGANKANEHDTALQYSTGDDLYGFRLHREGNRGD
jgi:prepilin-type N-terminal cleavage/methylation domain-containing protein